jgi:hypothetical protein
MSVMGSGRGAFLAGAIVLALAASASADVIHLGEGDSIEGRIVRDCGATVIVEVDGGKVHVERAQITSVERKPWSPAAKPTVAKPAPATLPAKPDASTTLPASAPKAADPSSATASAADSQDLPSLLAVLDEVAKEEAALWAKPDSKRLERATQLAAVRAKAIAALGACADPAALDRLAALLDLSFQPAREERRDRFALLDATAAGLRRAMAFGAASPAGKAAASALGRLSPAAVAALSERIGVCRFPAFVQALERVAAWQPAADEDVETVEARRNAVEALKLARTS